MTFWISLNRDGAAPLYLQIYELIRKKILQGELESGEKLPSTRQLAHALRVSRNVVLEAYAQLIAEGYLDNRPGSGTYVAAGTRLLDFCAKPPTRGVALEKSLPSRTPAIDFRTGIPALDYIPVREIKRIIQDLFSVSPTSLWNYGEAEGYLELRNQLVPFLYKTRGVYCAADQIVITSSTVQSLAMISAALLKPGDDVVIEDPSNEHIQQVFVHHGAVLLPVMVDRSGLNTALLPDDVAPHLIYTSPSHQFPLGSVMSIQRRLELIQYARTKQCYIVEDDYDSEFRYQCAPISSLQGLDAERVIYVGTFSKLLSPAFRIGYVVLPQPLMDPCLKVKRLADHHPPLLEQHIIARMLQSGFMVRHISRMLKIYKKRQTMFTGWLRTVFPEAEIRGDSTGIHIIAGFPGVEFTPGLLHALEENGVHVYPVEKHAIVKGRHSGKIIFGYVNLTSSEIEEGLQRIKKTLQERRRT